MWVFELNIGSWTFVLIVLQNKFCSEGWKHIHQNIIHISQYLHFQSHSLPGMWLWDGSCSATIKVGNLELLAPFNIFPSYSYLMAPLTWCDSGPFSYNFPWAWTLEPSARKVLILSCTDGLCAHAISCHHKTYKSSHQL